MRLRSVRAESIDPIEFKLLGPNQGEVVVSTEIETLEELCREMGRVGTILGNTTFSHDDLKGGFLSEFLLGPATQRDPVILTDEALNHTVYSVRPDLSVDEAVAAIMPLAERMINRGWTV